MSYGDDAAEEQDPRDRHAMLAAALSPFQQAPISFGPPAPQLLQADPAPMLPIEQHDYSATYDAMNKAGQQFGKAVGMGLFGTPEVRGPNGQPIVAARPGLLNGAFPTGSADGGGWAE